MVPKRKSQADQQIQLHKNHGKVPKYIEKFNKEREDFEI